MTKRTAGFTLLEVLVAVVIAALALGALYEGSVLGLESARRAAHYEEALSRARSHLAALLTLNTAAGTQSGDDGGGFHWETQETSLGTIAVAGPPGTPIPDLLALRVTISWQMDGAPHNVTLDSERLRSIVPPSP